MKLAPKSFPDLVAVVKNTNFKTGCFFCSLYSALLSQGDGEYPPLPQNAGVKETVLNTSRAPDVELSILSLHLCISGTGAMPLIGSELGFLVILKAEGFGYRSRDCKYTRLELLLHCKLLMAFVLYDPLYFYQCFA